MATKRGTIYSNIIGQWQLATDVYEDDYDVASNTSPVTLKLYLRRAYTYYGENGGTYSGQIRFDGNWKANYSGTIPYPTGIGTDWFYLTEVNTTAYHNSDGSYSPNISISAWGDFAPFNTNPIYNGGITFSTIPRATPAPNISCDVESSVPFTLSPYADFYQSVQIKFGDYEAYLLPSGKTSGFESKQPKSVTEWTFSADKDYYRRFDKKSLIGSLIVRTYNKSILHQSYTLIGTSTGQITINANANLCSPVITGTVVDTLDKTELGLTKNDLIKYVSKPELTATIQITAPNDNNATLTFLQVAGKTISDLTTRVFPIENPLNKSFLVKAINSRDFSTETVISASGEFIDYTLPTITITSAKRTEPTTGDATIEYKGDWFNNKFSENVSNTLTLTWKYKEKGQTAYTNGGTITPTIKDNTFSGTINVDGLFNYKKQYDIIVIVTDKLSSTQSVAQIPRGFPIFWWSENFVDILGELRINGANIGGDVLYSETDWELMLASLDTVSLDLTQYKYIDVYFCSYGFTGGSATGGNAINDIVRIDLTQPSVNSTLLYNNIDWRYGGSKWYPDAQFFIGVTSDPGFFIEGVFINNDKSKLLIGKTGYYTIASNSIGMTYDGDSSKYFRVNKIVGYK